MNYGEREGDGEYESDGERESEGAYGEYGDNVEVGALDGEEIDDDYGDRAGYEG